MPWYQYDWHPFNIMIKLLINDPIRRERRHRRVTMKPTYEELEKAVQVLKQKAQDRELAEKALKKRLVYEKMVADISTLAVMVEDLGAFMDSCLRHHGRQPGCVSHFY